MKLKSKGARRTLAATCSTAVVLAGASFFAAVPASAAGVTLAYGPTNTSATITNYDPTAATGASIAYGLKVTGTTDSDPLRVNALTAPSSAALYFQHAATANAAPAINSTGPSYTASTVVLRSVTDGATTNGSTTMTSATANFAAGDVGALVSGAGIPVSTTIASVTNSTTVVLSAAATATAAGVTVKIGGVPRSVTDVATTNTSTTITSGGLALFNAGDVGALVTGAGIPVGATIASVTNATTAVLSAAATATADPITVKIAGNSRSVADGVTTNTSTTITSATAAFTSKDVNGNITGTGIPAGTTIASVTNATTAVLSQAATATGTGVTFKIQPASFGLSGSAGANTITANANAFYLNGHTIKISKAGETTEIVNVLSGTTTLTLDRVLATAHSGATITDLGVSTALNPWTTVAAAASAPVTYSSSAPYANGDNLYFGAVTPGTYTFQLYKDHNGNGLYDSTQDDATPVFTLNVKDVNGATSSDSTDDLAPSLSVEGSVDIGRTITANVTTGLTTVDTRGLGGSPSVGVLGTNIATASSIAFTANGTGITEGTTSFDGTYVTETAGAATTAGTATTTYTLGSITRTANTTVAGNLVTAVAEDVTNVTGTVKDATGTAARAVYVKTGTADATYKGTVTVSSGDDSGKTVYFTLTTGTNSPALTANGTLVSSTSTTKVYSAVTDADGVATLKVTSGTTTAGTTYTVSIASGNITADLLSAAYQNATATEFEYTNTSAELLVTPGSSATLKGKLLDQFGAAFVPTGSDPAQVAIRIPADGATAGNAALSNGLFTYTYTPSTTPTAGTSTSFDFFYDTATDVDNGSSAINWASSETASSVTITAPVADATPTQQRALVTPAAGTAVTGSVLNANSAGLAYKSVTLTGTAGVYFSNVATPTTATTDDLATSLTVASNSSGIYTGYAFFTKAGTATITVTSGTATKTVTVAVTQAVDSWKITAVDAAVAPGATSVVTGTLKNGFDQPVSGATVNLSLGSSTLVALGQTSVTTSADGVWSTTITGAADGDGTATLTATINGQTANVTAHDDWLDNAGLTIPHGEFQDTATITVDGDVNKTTISAPASRAGAGSVTLTGHAKPSTTVEIYSKPTGTSVAYALVGVTTSEADGDWSSSEWVSSTTTFFAKTSVSTSSTVTVTVTTQASASATITAKALGGGRVKVTVNGSPNVKGTITLYMNGKKVKSWTSNAWGDGSLVVKTSRGVKTFKATFAPSGYKAGTSRNVSVRVR